MAAKKKKKTSKANAKKQKVIMIAAAVLIPLLLIGGFFLGIYLKLFDTEELNAQYGIYEWPVVGEYFVPKLSEEELKAIEKQKRAEEAKKKKEAEANKPIVLTEEEIAAQTAEREKEEKKRISKLSRFYNEMKPAEAAKIMSALDDDMAIGIFKKMDEGQVSQILAAPEFGEEKAASITRKMYVGGKQRVFNPDDQEL